MDTKLITEVYNQYKKSDYTVASDNLNPIREIALNSSIDYERIQNELYKRYKSKIAAFLTEQEDNLTEARYAKDLGLPYGDKESATIDRKSVV